MILSMQLTTIFLCIAVPVAAASCDSLARLKLPQTTISSVRLVTGGSFAPPGQQDPIRALPDFCRVQASIQPSPDSNIGIEVWLPVSRWNGKFQGIGNGGFAGSINYGATGLALALRRGYATAATDTGHSGGVTDASWALRHPEKVIDYGHRAIHLMTQRAKSLIHEFYGETPRYSYFASCSNGGRQGLMEAQRYPADYDGIIAGAPANDFTHLFIGFVWNAQALAKTPIRSEKLSAIESAVLELCDGLDGLQDGIIDDPDKCRFDPAKVLAADEASTLKAIYSGPRTSDGRLVFPGFPPGGETGPGGWNRWITGPEAMQRAFASQFLRNMAFANPAYDYMNFNIDRDLSDLNRKLAPVLNATSPDLQPFRNRGGKLILFHGSNDPAIPAQSTIDYYEQVHRTMTPEAADSFVRLYMAPGVQHCGGGLGPNSFGAIGEDVASMFTALEQWVETGKRPGPISATKFAVDGNPASGIARTRPLCPYPQIAIYKGTGSIDDAASFACKLP